MSARLATPINDLDGDIQRILPNYGHISNYKSTSSIISSSGSQLSLTTNHALHALTGISKGSVFPQGALCEFTIKIGDPVIPKANPIPENKYLQLDPTSLPKLAEDINLPANFQMASDMYFIAPNGYIHDLKKGQQFPGGYIIPKDSTLVGSSDTNHSCINSIPSLELTEDVHTPHFLPAGSTLIGPLHSNEPIIGVLSDGSNYTIDISNKLPKGEHLTLTNDTILPSGKVLIGVLPLDIYSDDFTTPNRPVVIPKGSILNNKDLNLTLSLSDTQPAILALNNLTDSNFKVEDPVNIFKRIFLSDKTTSIYSDASFDQINNLFTSLETDSGKVDNSVRLIELKAVLHLLTSLKDVNSKTSSFTDTNLVAFILKVREELRAIQDRIDEKKSATHSDDFGGYIEREEGFSKLITDRKHESAEIKNELDATSNSVRAAVYRSLDTNMKVSDNMDANKAAYEEFKTKYAKEAMTQGMDVITNRLDQIFEQAVSARTEFLDNTTRGKIQKTGAWFKKLGFWKKIGGFAAVGAGGVALGAATGIGAIPILTVGAMKVYSTYALGGGFKDLNKYVRTNTHKKLGNSHHANAIEMDYFLRSLPDTAAEDNRKAYEGAVLENRRSQRAAMNLEVKNAFKNSKYSNRIKALKRSVEEAKTPEESKSALLTLKLAYTEILTEILDNFMEKNLKAMIDQRRFRNAARFTEYGAGFMATNLLKYIPGAVESFADTISKTTFPDNFFDTSSVANQARVESSTGTLSKIGDFLGIKTASAEGLASTTPDLDSSSGPFNTDGTIKITNGNPAENITAKVPSSVTSTVTSTTPTSFTVPSDTVSKALVNDKTPGLSQMIEYFTGKDLSSSKSMEIARQIAKDNKILNVHKIFDGQKIILSSEVLEMMQKASGADMQTILKNVKKLT